MPPRTILYTGKGGVGKTSVAAATARRCAADGARTLVLSTDPAHSLADSLQAEVGAAPTAVGDHLFSLLQLKTHSDSGEWDTIIVDCAPTGETLRLLSFPDAARWWLDKVLGRESAMLSAARPFARAFLDVQLPDEKVIDDIQKLVANLIAMHELLREPQVSLRLV